MSSERPRIVKDVRFADDGSLRVYFVDGGEPLRGFADQQAVHAITYLKRMFPMILRSFSQKKLLGKVILTISVGMNWRMLDEFCLRIFNHEPVLLKDEHYCQCAKEVMRVLKGKLPENIVAAIGATLEYDLAYRLRFQDTVAELDKSKSIFTEIPRLFDILASREVVGYESMTEKWLQAKKLVKWILILSPKTCALVRQIVKEINLEEIKMNKEDIYWSNYFPTFNYRGKPIKEREEENIKKYGMEDYEKNRIIYKV